MVYIRYYIPNPEGFSVLTGDADSSLAALGGTEVAPGHAQTPVVLWAVEIFNLLTGHVDHHLAHLQPWDNRKQKTNLSKQISLQI